MGLLDSTTPQQYYQNEDFGNYQFTSLNNVINQFIVSYVGENKLISKLSRADVVFHAQRAMQELSFDVFKSCKGMEYTVPATLTIPLPQDYVNYTKVSWVDSSGIKHLLYPTNKTSNPFRPQQDTNGDFLFHNGDLIESGNLIQNENFQAGIGSWVLNSNESTPGTLSTYASSTSTATATFGDPVVGWFYGFNGNAIGAYNVPPDIAALRQGNVPIISGEDYRISFTISGYTTGTWTLLIVDENGDYTETGNVTSNGTYSEILTAGGTASNHVAQSVFIRNNLTGGVAVWGTCIIDNISVVRVGDSSESTTWANYTSSTPSENNNDNYEDDIYWPVDGQRYGLDPQHAQINGSYYIDCASGKIHFSSNISGKTVILDYISDSLGTNEEMQVHKFAEEAVYKWIAYAIMSTRANISENIVRRYKKEKFAEIRKAKLRLSNIKLEEITQIFRGKSKQIKH